MGSADDLAVRRRQAVAEMLTQQLPTLTAFLRHKVGADLAAKETIGDLAQSVCREVLVDIDRLELRSEEQFRSYLFLQATRKVVDRCRYHRQDKRDAARAARLPDDSRSVEELGIYSPLATPSRVADGRDQLARVERLLQQLPEAQRDAVMLSRLAGLDYADIARHQGVTEAAVRGLVARGLARLTMLLEAEEQA